MFRRLTGALLLSSALILPGMAIAAEIAADSKITGVTVFPRGALVTRVTEVSIQQGEHSVILKDLPRGTLQDSIRVEGVSDGKLEIGSVDVKRVYLPLNTEQEKKKSERKVLEEQIEKLKDEKAALDGELKALKVQQDYVSELSRLPAQPIRPVKDDDEARGPDWSGLFTLIGSQMSTLGKKELEIKIAQRKLDKQILHLRRKLSAQPPKQERRTQVRILVNADKDQKATLKVSYQILRAKWRPLYDARLETKDGPDTAKLELTRKASIHQSSGEMWDNVTLKLSTTAPNKRTSPPRLAALQVQFRPKQKSKVSSYGNKGSILQPLNSFSEAEQDAHKPMERELSIQQAPMPKKAKVRQRYAQVKQSAFQAVFEIPGKVSIASTGEAKKLSIGKVALKPTLKAVAVPKIQKAAFLSAKFTLPKDVQIMRGGVALHRDGVYIGRGFLPNLTSGAEHDLGFGLDEAIQVKYAEVQRSKGETGLISSSKTDERNFKISVKNFHSWTMPLTILDQVPFTENEKIEVKMLPETSKPSRKNVDDKRGLLAWDFDLKKGEERKLNLSYKIGWPGGEDLIYRKRY